MGYHPTSIAKLSQTQIRKLLRGERVRVKYGTHHKIMLSEEHHKKLHKAHLKHKGITIQLDPYAQDFNSGITIHPDYEPESGSGFFKDVGKVAKSGFHKLKDVAVKKAQKELPHLLNQGQHYAEHYATQKFHEYLPKATNFLKNSAQNYLLPAAEVGAEEAPLMLAAGFAKSKKGGVTSSVAVSRSRKGGALFPAGFSGGSMHHKHHTKGSLRHKAHHKKLHKKKGHKHGYESD